MEELLWLDDLTKALLLGNASWGLSYSRNFGEREHSALCYLMDPAYVISGTQETPRSDGSIGQGHFLRV